jgi:DnaJ like chaperone protein
LWNDPTFFRQLVDMWQGKLIGALVGYLIGRLPGAIIGAFIGHLFDAERAQRVGAASAANVQQVFFRATFQVMGHVAKSDGRVSEQEIQAARAVMAQFRLSEADKLRAIQLFTEGKAPNFPLQPCLSELARLCVNRLDLRLMFIQIQLQTTFLGGGLNDASRAVLRRVCDALNVSQYQFAQMEAMLHMQGNANGGGASPRTSSLDESYQVLGVDKSASDAEVTKAYRRLMNQNHPDKLVAKGLPESMMKAAEEKTRSIRAAYETICAARGIK